MSKFGEEEFGSDSDDEEYVPDGDGHAASEEENSGEDEDPEATAEKKKPKEKSKKKAKAKAPAGRASMFGESDDKIDWSAEAEKEKQGMSEQAEKKKTEDLWADFKKETCSVKPKVTPAAGGGLAALFSKEPPKPPAAVAAGKPKSRFGSIFDTVEPSNEAKEEVVKDVVTKPKSRFGALFDSPAPSEKVSKDTAVKVPGDKVEITKTYDFAGEAITVSKQVYADSKEAAKFLSGSSDSSNTKRPGGLAGVIGGMAKKPKLGCLHKSQLDWNSYVKENNIREELSTHNKGKDGYVEKLEFLERADLRQFEQEKALREKTRKSLMK